LKKKNPFPISEEVALNESIAHQPMENFFEKEVLSPEFDLS
jgi:hypothetical protein